MDEPNTAHSGHDDEPARLSNGKKNFTRYTIGGLSWEHQYGHGKRKAPSIHLAELR